MITDNRHTASLKPRNRIYPSDLKKVRDLDWPSLLYNNDNAVVILYGPNTSSNRFHQITIYCNDKGNNLRSC